MHNEKVADVLFVIILRRTVLRASIMPYKYPDSPSKLKQRISRKHYL